MAVSLNSGAGFLCRRPGFSASTVKNPGLFNDKYLYILQYFSVVSTSHADWTYFLRLPASTYSCGNRMT